MKQLSNHRKPAARTLAALAITTLLALAPTGCVNNDLGADQPTHNPEAGLDPETPVAITATLGAYGAASPTRSAAIRSAATRAGELTTAQIAAIPAEGEITASTNIATLEEGFFRFFGAASNDDGSTKTDYNVTGTVGAPALVDDENKPVSLTMRDFNINATTADGKTKQRHSRLGAAYFQTKQDYLIGFTDRALATDRKSAVYKFTLRHTTAKVSVLVVDGAGVPIDLEKGLNSTATLTAYHSPECSFETENPTSDTPNRLLSTYMNTKNATGDYPSTTAANVTFANYYTNILGGGNLKQPAASANPPKNLLNTLIWPNPTVKNESNSYFPYILSGDNLAGVTAIATGLSGANNPAAVLPFDATADKTNRHRITLSLKADDENGTSAGTYGINLNDIVLTGLPAGDGREDRLRYLLPGEHMIVTLKIDRNKILSATAILAPWTEATADGGNLGDTEIPGGGGEMPAPFEDIEFSKALADMKFDADGTLNNNSGTQKLTLDAKGRIDITNAANLTLLPKITKISDISSGGIRSLRGIEYLTALTELHCGYNHLTTLDVSRNTALTDLSCRNNRLTTLDVSKNTALTDLNCFQNSLTTLDVSRNTALEWLDCSGNRLTTINASKMTLSYSLYCGKQTTDGTTAQPLALTLRENQKNHWNNILKIFSDNTGVNVTYIGN